MLSIATSCLHAAAPHTLEIVCSRRLQKIRTTVTCDKFLFNRGKVAYKKQSAFCEKYLFNKMLLKVLTFESVAVWA